MSPPITATCATPPVDNKRGRIVQSAIVRKSCKEVLSAVNPKIIISPKMEDCGPRVGCPTLLGKTSPNVDSFSDTIWRAV